MDKGYIILNLESYEPKSYTVTQNCFIQVTQFHTNTDGFGANIELDSKYEFAMSGSTLVRTPLIFPCKMGQVITWNRYASGYLWEIPFA